MREIVLDTETTGLSPESGDRVVEIGCIELINTIPTRRHFHTYINPERDMPAAAFQVHGLSAEFLAAHPVFAEIADKFIGFVGEARLVIHNAAFDLRFLNHELARLGLPALDDGRPIVDTLDIARRKFPGAPANLDALCRRFAIDLSGRDKHGALLDAELLAAVYLELQGGRQPGLALAARGGDGISVAVEIAARPGRTPRPHAASADELAAHRELLAKIADPLWDRPGPAETARPTEPGDIEA